jgi:hypothetical protein
LLFSGPGRGAIDIQGLSTFVKYGSEILLGFPPKKLSDIMKKIPSLPKSATTSADLPIKLLASPAKSTEMKALLMETFQTICNDLVEAHKQFRTKEMKFEKDRLLHGTLTEQKQQEYDSSKKLYEKLLSVATSLSESIGEPIPELKVSKQNHARNENGNYFSILFSSSRFHFLLIFFLDFFLPFSSSSSSYSLKKSKKKSPEESLSGRAADHRPADSTMDSEAEEDYLGIRRLVLSMRTCQIY